MLGYTLGYKNNQEKKEFISVNKAIIEYHNNIWKDSSNRQPNDNLPKMFGSTHSKR